LEIIFAFLPKVAQKQQSWVLMQKLFEVIERSVIRAVDLVFYEVPLSSRQALLHGKAAFFTKIMLD
jgi:hypothetical protein